MSSPIALVIEDDKLLGEVYRDVLNMCGFQTQHIIDSQLAMDAIRATVPTLIMLDLNLSRISGVDILLWIRQDETFSNTRVIVATGNSYAMQDETITAHADLVLFKPISIQQIMDFVSRIRTTSTNETAVVAVSSTEPEEPTSAAQPADTPAEAPTVSGEISQQAASISTEQVEEATSPASDVETTAESDTTIPNQISTNDSSADSSKLLS
jgi:DNA-binding response OmpR family regulator